MTTSREVGKARWGMVGGEDDGTFGFPHELTDGSMETLITCASTITTTTSNNNYSWLAPSLPLWNEQGTPPIPPPLTAIAPT